jgi:DNA-binding NarL/FixJ family response regulator
MNTIRVSQIEDDQQTRALFGDWISKAEFLELVSEHGTAEDAIERLPGMSPHVVVTDINLPGLSGVECVRRLKPLLPKTQFLMLTVYDDAEHLFDALAAGATGYLLKREHPDDLIRAIHEAHQGASPMTGSIARKVVQFFQNGPRRKEVGTEANLSARETTVLELLAQGLLYKEIADTLGISVLTVNSHIRRIYEKMHVQSRAQAVAKFMSRKRF